MRDVSRRQFVGGSVAGSLALAGCSGVPGLGGDSTSESDSHLQWFGPEVVKTQWSIFQLDLDEPIPDDQRTIVGYQGFSPRRATDGGALGDDAIQTVRDLSSTVQLVGGSIDLDPETVELHCPDVSGAYAVVTGDLDAVGIEEQISGDVERTASHGETTIHVRPRPTTPSATSRRESV